MKTRKYFSYPLFLILFGCLFSISIISLNCYSSTMIKEKYYNLLASNFLSEKWTHVSNNKGIATIEIIRNDSAFSMSRISGDLNGANVAYYNDLIFKDGIIECDIMSPVKKGWYSFIGLLFRAVDERQYECIYFRPFISDQIGAIQYMPVFNSSIINWQDYTNDAYKAKAIIPEQEWFKVKIEFKGAELKVYINDTIGTPKMTISTLGLGDRSGKIGLWLGNSEKLLVKNLKITVTD